MQRGDHRSKSSFLSRLNTTIILLGCFLIVHSVFQYGSLLLAKYSTEYNEQLEPDAPWPVLDVVYTWVNGSDPILQEQLARAKRELGIDVDKVEHVDASSTSASRFQDNEELRYSLRSIEKFAPWVRHIFLVTNGQVPHWLNIDHPKLSIITHQQIFEDPSNLPTFSSPAIESQLHNIPNLAQHFVYFNDDVMLGVPVFPEDFKSRHDGTKIYLSWRVPNCAENCHHHWLGDGVCDLACNITLCDYDLQDCINPKEIRKGFGNPHKKYVPITNCVKSCPTSWLSDGFCDAVCNVHECAFDAGDCGLEDIVATLPSATPTEYDDSLLIPWSERTTSYYINMTLVFQNYNFTEALFDNPTVVRLATISHSQKLVFVTIYSRDTEENIEFAFYGRNEATNETIEKRYTIVYLPKDWNKPPPPEEAPVPDIDPFLISSELDDLGDSSASHGDHDVAVMEVAGCVGSNNHTLDSNNYSESNNIIEDNSENDFVGSNNENNSEGVYNGESSKENHDGSDNIQQQEQTAEMKVSEVEETRSKSNDSPSKEIHEHAIEGAITPPEHHNSTQPTSILKKMKNRFLHDRLQLEKEQIRFFSEAAANSGLDDDRPQHLEGDTFRTGRTLQDTFGDSLKHSNTILTKSFGNHIRKVPAHMPHMIDTHIFKELLTAYPEQWKETASHKFRSGLDMQYSFSYFYYLMHSRPDIPPMELFQLLDVDHDGFLNENEMRSAALRAYGHPIQEKLFADMKANLTSASNDTYERVTFEAFEQQTELVQFLGTYYADKFQHKHRILNADDVAFLMINQSDPNLQENIDGIRHRQHKFICINDNIDHSHPKAPEAVNIIHQFYRSLVPLPSVFELPTGESHSYQYYDDIMRMRRRNTHRKLVIVMVIFVSFCLLVWASLWLIL